MKWVPDLNLMDTSLDYSHGFNSGYVCGAGLSLIALLLIVVLLAFLHFKRRRCAGVTVKGNRGDVFISARAVDDTILAVARDFSDLAIRKTSLLRQKEGYCVRVVGALRRNNVALPALSDSFRERLFHTLENNLGIASVDAIHLEIQRVQTGLVRSDNGPELDESELAQQ